MVLLKEGVTQEVFATGKTKVEGMNAPLRNSSFAESRETVILYRQGKPGRALVWKLHRHKIYRL